MARFFNTTGPCDPHWHYMLPPDQRLPDLFPYVERQLYFALHAPRQTGKTTAMLAFAEKLRERGYVALHTSLERSFGMTEVADAEPTWLWALHMAGTEQLPPADRPPDPALFQGATGTRLSAYLAAWCAQVKRPVVLLLDEADTVTGHAVVNLLRQLRAGFNHRGPGKFPVTVALIGMRDLRDYLTAAKDGTPVSNKSPFNIKEASLTLRNFTKEEVTELYGQHTIETGQIFTPESIDQAWYWTCGQPFMVNSLAKITINDLTPTGEAITAAHINEAKKQLILSRTTHIDNLAERLKDERVAKIVTPVLLGEPGFMVDLGSDDLLYCKDLGLLTLQPRIEAANPIYREVLIRLLTQSRQADLPERTWLRDGKLDVHALVDSFFVWWRRNADALRARDTTPYREAVPQIVFMAWVQKVVNGGGEVGREFALGRGRIDLVIHFADEIHAFELKRVTDYDGLETVREEGIAQALGYLDRLGTSEGWILIFDERARSWEEKLWKEELEVEGKKLHLRGG
jgi:hypothetical protein